MNTETTTLNPANKRAWTFPVAAKPTGWQPSAEFILALAFLGDLLVIFSSLSLGYWLRFDSGLIPFPAGIQKSAAAGIL